MQFGLGSVVESGNLENWNTVWDNIKVDLGDTHWIELPRESSYCNSVFSPVASLVLRP